MTAGRVYTAIVFYLVAAVLGWKGAQFATVSVLQAMSTGYGLVWAILSVQLIIGGFLGALYFMFLGRDTGRRDLAAAGSALTASIVAGCAWLIMGVALL
jgi:hypothetical protein